METRRAWLVLSLGDEREYRGNEGYADDLKSVYRYDSFVPNHKQIIKGDLLILRDGKSVLGTAVVTALREKEGSKSFKRCPRCKVANIKERKVKTPRYKCREGHLFEEREVIKDERECTLFEAHFEGTFRPLAKRLAVAEVRAACPRYNGQLAMQQLDLERLQGDAKRLLSRTAPSHVLPEGVLLAADEADDSYVPDKRDDRKVLARQIRERRGQRRFRQQLRSRFADRCLVTGCAIVELLEACHINPHRGDKDNQPSNGLLLRTDIHTLFDLDLLGIEPESLRIRLHPTLVGSEYEQFAGDALSCNPKLLSKKALDFRWEAFQLNCLRSGRSRIAG